MGRRSVVVLGVLSGVFSVVTAVAVNVATGGTLPEPVAWPVVGGLAAAAVALAVWQQRVPGEARTTVSELPAGTGLTGREGDLERLSKLIKGGHRVIAVVGPPGVGKSALAVRVAHEHRSRYPDGQLFAVLRGADADPVRPESVLERFDRTLNTGTPNATGTDHSATLDELAARWRARLAGRRMIIVLDDARDAAQVRPLLPGDTATVVLITSRRMLHDLPGVAQHTLGALTDDDARRLLREAAARDSENTTTPADDGTNTLVTLCGGLPLALSIVAARLRARPAWTPADLAARLADERHRLTELRLGDLAVRASFATSYADQPAPDREVFRRAGSHPGRTFTTAAAAALADQSEATVAAALERLVDAHLVESPAPGLFRLHDLLRLFATEKLTAPEHRECLGRLLTWMTAHPGPDERENVIAAVHQGVALGLHEPVWDLVMATLPLLRRASDHADQLTLWTAAAEAAKALGDDERRVRALQRVSWGYDRAGRAEPALAAADEAVALAGHIDDPHGLAAAVSVRGARSGSCAGSPRRKLPCGGPSISTSAWERTTTPTRFASCSGSSATSPAAPGRRSAGYAR
ncbi:NB-ARC domain-containing protein [Symbioplanes lichenis]|uniref:NB-ARC domain-containing protein n=1 Tax=Symbioplanes lichenis TaxID=1629072 RepID=UPI002739B298|nr:NB-ARC domain-containing protein [Actinoplanes lichenis]